MKATKGAFQLMAISLEAVGVEENETLAAHLLAVAAPAEIVCGVAAGRVEAGGRYGGETGVGHSLYFALDVTLDFVGVGQLAAVEHRDGCDEKLVFHF